MAVCVLSICKERRANRFYNVFFWSTLACLCIVLCLGMCKEGELIGLLAKLELFLESDYVSKSYCI